MLSTQRKYQEAVNQYFDAQSSYWKEIYSQKNVYAQIHQQRQERVLAWIDELGLAAGSRVLDAGCGAGFLALALAQRGFVVQALDSVEAMVNQTRQHAQEAGLAEQITVEVGDISSLPFADQSFDLVLAIGVFPWIPSVEPALRELKRVLKLDGRMLFATDNRGRLNFWLDPLHSPLLFPLRWPVKALLSRLGLRRYSASDVNSHFYTTRFIDQLLNSFELVKVKYVTLGFGPFTLFHLPLLSDAAGLWLHGRLQRLAERSIPVFRSTGSQYIVLACHPLPVRRGLHSDAFTIPHLRPTQPVGEPEQVGGKVAP